jgi:hypothetical protein
MARRSNGEGSFYQQKDKSWVYQVTYGRKEDGSPYRKAFKGRTKTICKERRAQWEEIPPAAGWSKDSAQDYSQDEDEYDRMVIERARANKDALMQYGRSE